MFEYTTIRLTNVAIDGKNTRDSTTDKFYEKF